MVLWGKRDIVQIILTSHFFLINKDNRIESGFIALKIEGPQISTLTIGYG